MSENDIGIGKIYNIEITLKRNRDLLDYYLIAYKIKLQGEIYLYDSKNDLVHPQNENCSMTSVTRENFQKFAIDNKLSIIFVTRSIIFSGGDIKVTIETYKNHRAMISYLEKMKKVVVTPGETMWTEYPFKFRILGQKEEWEMECLGTNFCSEITEKIERLYEKTIINEKKH